LNFFCFVIVFILFEFLLFCICIRSIVCIHFISDFSFFVAVAFHNETAQSNRIKIVIQRQLENPELVFILMIQIHMVQE